MRCWRPLPVVLALLSGCYSSGRLQEEGDSGSTSAQEARPWEPCERVAVPLGPPLREEDLESRQLVHAGPGLFFAHDDGVTGLELWVSSGTRGAGTLLVKDILPGPDGSGPMELTRVGSRLFFTVEEPGTGRELWVSDGTPAGTRMVKDIWPGPTGSIPRSLFEFKGRLYFAAGTEEHGRELWRSDGTPEGTFLVEDLEPGPEGSAPDRFTRGGDGSLYYLAHFGGFFTALMRSHGGPGAVELFRRPTESSILESLTPVGRRLFFVTGDLHEDTVDLMVTQGGAPVRVGMFGEARDLVSMGGRLYFTATLQAGTEPHEEATDLELWRSDGTARGTQRVKDLRPGSEGSSPRGLTVVGRQLFFTADDGVHGPELWVSDGTDSGTQLFADLEPGAAGSSPEALAVLEGNLFFSAKTAGRGREPWVSNGMPGGTVALGEPAPGVSSSDPSRFVRSGWDAFFTADDGMGTLRLWALPLRPAGRCDARER